MHEIVHVNRHELHGITHIGLAYKEGVNDGQRWGWQRGRAARGAQWSAGPVEEHDRC